MIYGHIIGSYVWPREELSNWPKPPMAVVRVFGQAEYHKYDDRWMEFANTSQYSFDPAGNKPPPRWINIQFTCKQVKAEIRKFTRTSTIPHFHNHWTITHVIPRLQGKWLRRISLGFPNSVYFKFLGFNDQRLAKSPSEAPIHVLGKIPTLTRLDFHFQVSLPRQFQWWNHRGSYYCFSHDPWGHLLQSHSIELIFCQKTLLDWFFTLALEALRGIQCVTMSGHVKHSTRTKWEAILHDERNGTLHDLSAERLVIVLNYLRRPL
jgi:hypothetical protein